MLEGAYSLSNNFYCFIFLYSKEDLRASFHELEAASPRVPHALPASPTSSSHGPISWHVHQHYQLLAVLGEAAALGVCG